MKVLDIFLKGYEKKSYSSGKRIMCVESVNFSPLSEYFGAIFEKQSLKEGIPFFLILSYLHVQSNPQHKV